MAYCSKCGTKNEEDAEHCKKCGASLSGKATDRKKDIDNKCEEECAIGKRSPYAKFFWGIILILLGIWIFFEIIVEETELKNYLPDWVIGFDFWWLIGIVIVVAFVLTGIRIITRE